MYKCVIICFIILVGCNSNPKLTAEQQKVVDDLKIMLPEGRFLAGVMDGTVIPDELKILTQKYQMGINTNAKWYIEAMDKLPANVFMPEYSPKSGLTEAEFKRYYELSFSLKDTISETDTVDIFYEDNCIKFTGTGKMSVLDDYVIKLDSVQCIAYDNTLHFVKAVDANSDANMFNSGFKGYKWAYGVKPDADPDILFNSLDTTMITRYETLIVKLTKSNKTVLMISGKEVFNNEVLSDYHYPVILTQIPNIE
jgi:hypothetical protein